MANTFDNTATDTLFAAFERPTAGLAPDIPQAERPSPEVKGSTGQRPADGCAFATGPGHRLSSVSSTVGGSVSAFVEAKGDLWCQNAACETCQLVEVE